MKIFLLIAGMAMSLAGVSQTALKSKMGVPSELLTNDSTHWMISTLSNMQYTNTTPGAYYNTYKNGGGMIVKFKFTKDGRYEFMLYVQVNSYGMDTESWSYVEGTVEFDKDAKGHSIMKTFPIKGTYRYTKNGQTTSRAATAEELRKSQRKDYLWERWEDPKDLQNTYMLVVDLMEHPKADVDVPGSIDPSWVSKFHIPKR